MFIFNSRLNTLRVTLRPSKRLIVGTQVVKEEGLTAVFERGIFTTEDADTAQLLRDKIKKTKDTGIIEIGAEDERAFNYLKKGKNVRTAVTAAEVSKVNPQQTVAMTEKDQALKCPICDKTFKNQKGLNIHLVSHRPDVQLAADKTEAPEAAAPKISETPEA